MVKIFGIRKHQRRLANIRAKTAKDVVRALYVAGQQIEIDAEISITSGSISGKGHIPSAPGQPPNADTRQLDTNIETTIESSNPPTIHVTSKAPYSAALEFGTSKMAERPFMRPAAKKNRDDVSKQVSRAVSRITKQG